MQLKNLLPVALGAAAVSAQSLTEALASQNATLSMLTSTSPPFLSRYIHPLTITSPGLLQADPALLTVLGGLSDITVLAPSDAALSTFLNSTAGAAAGSNAELVAALLTYHVLNGTVPSSAITNTTAFVPSVLNNSTYSNVTGGQVVGAQTNGSSVNIYSGLLQKSTVTTAVSISTAFLQF